MRYAEIIQRLRQRAPSHHSVDVGLRTEAVITAELLRRGVRVLLPCGFNHRYDLVLDLDGEFVRVQCKTGRLRRGAVHFNSESVRSNSKTALRRSYDGEAEIFIVHCPEIDEIYAVPVAEAPKARRHAPGRSHGELPGHGCPLGERLCLARLAQLAEHSTCNGEVLGSNPRAGSGATPRRRRA